MDESELKEMLSPLDLPIAYRFFKEYENKPIPNPPYLIYLIPNLDNVSADSKVYHKFYNVQLELYTDERELKLINKVGNILTQNNIYYEQYENYIQSESMYQTVFLFSI